MRVKIAEITENATDPFGPLQVVGTITEIQLKDRIILMNLYSVQPCGSQKGKRWTRQDSSSRERFVRQGTLPIFELKGFVSLRGTAEWCTCLGYDEKTCHSLG